VAGTVTLREVAVTETGGTLDTWVLPATMDTSVAPVKLVPVRIMVGESPRTTVTWDRPVTMGRVATAATATVPEDCGESPAGVLTCTL
jgi:hypothetical protein